MLCNEGNQIQELNGLARVAIGGKYPLLGVAPQSKVALHSAPGVRKTRLDPNHSHFGLPTVKNWGDETKTMFELSETLASKNIPVVCVVGNGGIHTVGGFKFLLK